MRYTLEFHPLAKIDLVEAFTWYEAIRPELGERMEAETKQVLIGLADQPMLNSIRIADIRRANLNKFPYGVFNFVSDRVVIILGVLHAARDSERELLQRRVEN